MGERRQKTVIAGVAVALVYGFSTYAIWSDPTLGAAARSAFPYPVQGQYVLALLPTALFSFFMAVDTALPIGSSALDMVHGGLVSVYRHLFVDGEHNNYWHLRIVIALSAVVAVQLLAIAVECLPGG